MAVADTLAAKFNGKVAQSEYSQIVMLESGTTGTTVQSFWRNLVTSRTVEQVFTFEGCTFAEAHYAGSVTVTDIDNTSYTLNTVGSVTDGSTGSATFPVEEVTVERRRVSPHMWTLEVRRKGMAYYVNGTKLTYPESIKPPKWTGL